MAQLHQRRNPQADGLNVQPGADAEWKEQVKASLGKRLDWLSSQLEGTAYVMGEKFSVADAYLFTVLGWATVVSFDLIKWPVLQEYAARVAQRPKVQAALRAEGLLQ